MKPKVDLSGTTFDKADDTGNAANFISYLDQATNEFGNVKAFTQGLLALKQMKKS